MLSNQTVGLAGPINTKGSKKNYENILQDVDGYQPQSIFPNTSWSKEQKLLLFHDLSDCISIYRRFNSMANNPSNSCRIISILLPSILYSVAHHYQNKALAKQTYEINGSAISYDYIVKQDFIALPKLAPKDSAGLDPSLISELCTGPFGADDFVRCVEPEFIEVEQSLVSGPHNMQILGLELFLCTLMILCCRPIGTSSDPALGGGVSGSYIDKRIRAFCDTLGCYDRESMVRFLTCSNSRAQEYKLTLSNHFLLRAQVFKLLAKTCDNTRISIVGNALIILRYTDLSPLKWLFNYLFKKYISLLTFAPVNVEYKKFKEELKLHASECDDVTFCKITDPRSKQWFNWSVYPTLFHAAYCTAKVENQDTMASYIQKTTIEDRTARVICFMISKVKAISCSETITAAELEATEMTPAQLAEAKRHNNIIWAAIREDESKSGKVEDGTNHSQDLTSVKQIKEQLINP